MICDWLTKWSLYCPDKVAVKEVNRQDTLNYSQLNQAANSLSAWLEEQHNIRKGDRILVLANFHMEYVSLLGVTQKTGAILVPINYRLSPSEIAFLVKNSDPSLIIVADEYRPLLDEVPALLYEKIISFQFFSDFVQKNKDSNITYKAKTLEETHPAFILYTSGTTGQPKGAVYTHGMMLWNSLNTALRLQITFNDINLNVMPPFHTGGWNVLTTPILHAGGTMIMMPKFDAKNILHLLESEKVSIFMAVPTMVRMMSDCPLFEKANFEALRYMIVGGEALPVPLIEQWADQGVPIRQGFGLTECGPNIFSLEARDAIRKRGSIGFPNFYVECKLMNEDGVEASANENGELWIKGPIVTPGYWRNISATEKSIQDGWFKTGDILMKDSEGYFYVVDRIKNMFISGGENVYPAEIEKCLLQHEAIKEVCVVGVPDDKWGEVGKAFLIMHENVPMSMIKDYCCEKLAKYKVPKFFEVISELPKNDTGKINRKALSALPHQV
ncbi:class I adenylate-forming enzyme family protein [Fulvivirga ligni]|uniref:class I adenylate-forming enzyme family protein n=1 Tax=Fulvivirga ligni TaxID=2904246 RepID=UPI001F27088A|nr:AMP-binding protein [Fulvivirga ligni]UII20889.1 AMP-binding protein [Fulvivirga ligni]